MLVFLARLSRLVRPLLTGWALPLTIALFVFLSSWLAMWLVEPADNPITMPQNYPWYFVVTAATVGYGDMYPASAAGHVVGAYVIIGGIVALTMLFTHLVETISAAKGQRMRGLADIEIQGHIVLIGYAEGRTERLISELIAEPHVQLVLCAWDNVHEHPMPDCDRVYFVRGDLTDDAVLARAGVARAATVLVDGRDDNESLALAVAVAHASRPSGQRGAAENRAHLIVALRDMNRASQFHYVSTRIQCVQWHVPNLLVEEAHDPGISQVYTELMTSGGSGNTYSLRLSRDYKGFGDVQTDLGRRFSATALGVRRGGDLVVSPPWDEPVAAGTTVYYVAKDRLDPRQL
ncbi:ion channel [Antrihabitans sp. YC2-6]|uniref:ion channel n=1 Tax=Antrihabitans sp. YC2-6 TaxID=2799498 RepID=UPI0018F5D00F|nr:ion channel [Antrihabitans sp. YC2-6]MBJ8347714.1 hypothetical protein [Antrihabitans sp. YC2-6]